MFLPDKFSVELLTASEIRQTTSAFQKQLRLNEVIRVGCCSEKAIQECTSNGYEWTK